MKTECSRRNHKERLYIAYGSNLNLAQMAGRCPTAEVVGKAVLRGWRLAFRSVATIERRIGYTVPVLVWKLCPEDETALDRYEGWPNLYYNSLKKQILNQHGQREQISRALNTLGQCKEELEKFSPDIWNAMVDTATVFQNKTLLFRFREGTEISVPPQQETPEE